MAAAIRLNSLSSSGSSLSMALGIAMLFSAMGGVDPTPLKDCSSAATLAAMGGAEPTPLGD